jgi:hypothetical protein
MVEQIRFEINANGEVSVNVECATGSQCENMTRPFEENLGAVAKKEYKDSYFAEVSSDQSMEIERGSNG